MTHLSLIPGWEGSIGPFPGAYYLPHVYARDICSGTGNCVCGASLLNSIHIQAAPGIPIPGNSWANRDPELGWHRRNNHYLEIDQTDWRCLICRHVFDSATEADDFVCGEDCCTSHRNKEKQ